jgi:low temperature requirement protein LtrA
VALLPSAIRLRQTVITASDRKVTWLELFFDLVFVAAVSQVAEPLREHYTLAELARFTPLFLLIWWAWTGRAIFSTRFESDDAVQRALTVVEMFVVAVMAANARDSLVSRSSAGFAAAYAAVRIILLVHYLRAANIREAQTLTAWYMSGHGIAAALWMASALVPVDARLTLWLVAFAIDLGTPWAAIEHSARVPPHPAHLPERFGLFTLILLGESVVAVMKGIESQETWSVPAAGTALLGMLVLFAIWWWYFERSRATGEHEIRGRRDAMRLHLWSYAHFPLYLAIVVIGVGMQRLVTSATHAAPRAGDVTLWVVGTGLLVVAMHTISAAAPLRLKRGPVQIRGAAESTMPGAHGVA